MAPAALVVELVDDFVGEVAGGGRVLFVYDVSQLHVSVNKLLYC